MAPSRRIPSNGHISVQNSHSHANLSRQSKAQRHRSQPSISATHPEQPNLGMSPASRYNHNLKVLRRRDPSIVSIFDQFSHVCVYHHNGKKWEKQGFEGSMFLYERESYPPYGFYILNRMGMDDYIQRLFPEDDIGAHGSYLMLRSYPEFTTRRLSLARSTSEEIPHKFADCYAVPNPEKLLIKDKGRSQTVGLWMFATDAREPMIDVMMRLHSYIKKNIPYPEEFRYGPDRPPPPNPHLRTTSTSTSTSSSSMSPSQGNSSSEISLPSHPSLTHTPHHSHALGGQDHFSANHPSQAYTNGGVSELDMLFAKLSPTPVLSAASPSTTQIPNSTSTMTVESLFAVLSGAELHDSPAPTLPPSGSSSSNRGLALLDSIFASADSNTNTSIYTPPNTNTNPLMFPSSTSPSRPPTTQPETITIYSPTPTTTALPQILTQDVISSLLGLPPSRTASAANSTSTTYSGGGHSHSSSREGDNEDEGEGETGEVEGEAGLRLRRVGRGSDGGYSESSTVLDPEAEMDEELMAAGASAGRPLLGFGTGDEEAGCGSEFQVNRKGRVNGDVTPRPLANGHGHWMRASTLPHPVCSEPGPRLSVPAGVGMERGVGAGGAGILTTMEPSSSTSTIRELQGPLSRSHSQLQESDIANANAGITRPLIPFEAESELWPYPRPPLDDRSLDVDGEDGEIVELDFEDTSALSDPDVFRRVLQQGRKGGRGHSGAVDRDSSAADGGSRSVAGKDRERGKGKKKGKKERAADREKEREDIERGWDVPGSQPAMKEHERYPELTVPSPSPSPVPMPSPPRQLFVEMETPTTAKPGHTQNENGMVHAHSRPVSKGKTQMQGKGNVGMAVNGPVDGERVKESLIAAVSAQARKPVTMERNEFVREVLTLIHTDKTFVDTLWRDYMARLQ